MTATILVVAGPENEAVAELFSTALRAEGVGAELVTPADMTSVLRGQPDETIGVAACGVAAEPALHAAADDGRVAALLLVAAPLSPAATSLIGRWPELPVLALAEADDRAALAGAVDAYLASSNPASDLEVGPLGAEVVEGAARWLRDRLATVATIDEVVLATTDGWEVHGTRWLPATPTGGAVPGVVLLHSGRSDRAVFSRLERLLAERALAVLNIDWRGRGRTTNRGSYFDLDLEERAAGWRDAAAAFDHLADLPQVDADRLAAVGVVHGAEHAVRAATRDRRVRAIAILTGYRPADESESARLTSGDVHALYVTSRDHTITTAAMRALHDATPPGRSRYVEYPGGAIGYQLFELDHDLEPSIVDWLVEVLGPVS
jgi:dienelactone hydrolase